MWNFSQELRQANLLPGLVDGGGLFQKRTVHAPFDAHGSSLSFRPFHRTRFLHVETLAMNLLMTSGME
jgi:hypothetical protein